MTATENSTKTTIGNRIWIVKNPPTEQSSVNTASAADAVPHTTFRLLSYNVLAQALIKRGLYPHCTKLALKLKSRAALLLRELLALEAHVMALQELDFLPNLLDNEGFGNKYEYRFCEKPGSKHGLGMFWDREVFECLAYETLAYAANGDDEVSQDATAGNIVTESENSIVQGETVSVEKRSTNPVALEQSNVEETHDEVSEYNHTRPIKDRRNVAQLIALRHFATSAILVFTNTHLYWKPEAIHVKLAQVTELLAKVKAFCDSVEQTYARLDGVFMCGDWNITPDSIVYHRLVGEGRALPTLGDDQLSKDRGEGDQEGGSLPRAAGLGKICSVYAFPKGIEPPFTTVTMDFRGTLDYMFEVTTNGSDSLASRVVQVLALPPEEEVALGLPDQTAFGSDHLCLCADLLACPPSLA